MTTLPRSPVPRASTVESVDFHLTKYGPELLVDTAWVREMPTFLRLSPHALTFYDILLVTEGQGWFWLDAHRFPVRAGQVFFTTPGQVRRWAVSGLDGICLFFPALFLEEFFHDRLFLHRLPYFHVPDVGGAMQLTPKRAARLRRRLLAMRREFNRLRPDSAHLLRARLYEVLITLAREYARIHRLTEERTPHLLTLRFRELVDRRATRWHQVKPYARELGVSPGHLNTLAKRHLGRSAKRVVQERLATEARRLLLYSERSAAEVGYALGFKDPSYFGRFFRQLTGRSPRAFRKAGVAGAKR